MSLRRRLVAAFTLLLLLSLTALAVLATRSTNRVLLAQADEELLAIAARLGERDGEREAARTRDQQESLADRRFAIMSLGSGGAVDEALASGFSDSPDSLPRLDTLDELIMSPGSIRTVGSEDGSTTYRAVAIVGSDGVTSVLAIPIDDIGAATSDLTGWLLLGGALVGVAGAAATWLIVRRGLKPVDAMVETATAIAEGDLTRRIPDDGAATELGRLGTALNGMLSQLDHAFAQEKASQQKLNRFVADASHELRTPLATLQGYSQMYRAGALQDPAELDAAMTRIRKESSRMQRLVDDLLLLAGLDLGQTLDIGPVDLAAILGDTIADSHAIEPQRQITYSGPTKLMIRADESRLAQVFTNLIANARTHTPAGSSVEVYATRFGDIVAVDVVDSGGGIPEDQLDRIFDRFSQLELTSAKKAGGAGLGLAIVAAIVDAHDGTVSATNARSGGACFQVTLPAAEASLA